MQIFIEAIDLNIWEAIEIGPYIPTTVAGNATIEKPREQWDEEKRRRVQYNLKAKNINSSNYRSKIYLDLIFPKSSRCK